MNQDFIKISKAIKSNNNNIFYTEIFNIITENDTVKNYSNNNNGIFFDFNKFSKETITSVLAFIDAYTRKENEKIMYEKKRKDTLDSNNKEYVDTMTKLSEKIEKCSILHTEIDLEDMEVDETNMFGDETDEDEDL